MWGSEVPKDMPRWAPGQEELVNPIKAMAREAEVGTQMPATSPASSLRGSWQGRECGVGWVVPTGVS